jgi:hypothetical protein
LSFATNCFLSEFTELEEGDELGLLLGAGSELAFHVGQLLFHIRIRLLPLTL